MPEPQVELDSAAPQTQIPPRGTEEWERFLDGPRPEVGQPGRGQWLRGQRDRRAQERAQRGEEPPTAAPAGEGLQGDGLVELLVGIASDAGAPQAARVAAIRTALEQASSRSVTMPTTDREVREATDEQLYAWAHELGL